METGSAAGKQLSLPKSIIKANSLALPVFSLLFILSIQSPCQGETTRKVQEKKKIFLPIECFDQASKPGPKLEGRPAAQSSAKKPVPGTDSVWGLIGGAHGTPRVEVSYYGKSSRFLPNPGDSVNRLSDPFSFFERGVMQALWQLWSHQCYRGPNDPVEPLGRVPVRGSWSLVAGASSMASWPSNSDPVYGLDGNPEALKRYGRATKTNETGFWVPSLVPCSTYIQGFAELLVAIDENGVVSVWNLKSDLPEKCLKELDDGIIELADHPAFALPASVPRKTIRLYMLRSAKEIDVKACLLRVSFSVSRPPGVLIKDGASPLQTN